MDSISTVRDHSPNASVRENYEYSTVWVLCMYVSNLANDRLPYIQFH